MRRTKIKVLIHILGIILAAILTTIALYTDAKTYYTAALWLLVLTLVSTALHLVDPLLRTVRQIELTNERITELNSRQKIHYQELLEILAHSPNRTFPHAAQSHLDQAAEIEAINSRIQRTERRVLGRLEDELRSADLRYARLEEILLKIPGN